MKNTVTLCAHPLIGNTLICNHGGEFYLCREGVSAAFPEAATASSLTIETRLKPSKKRGERKIVIVDAWEARVAGEKFSLTYRRSGGMARVVGANSSNAFTFYASLKK